MNELATRVPNTIELQELPEYDIQDYDVFDEKDFTSKLKRIKDKIAKELKDVGKVKIKTNLQNCFYLNSLKPIRVQNLKIHSTKKSIPYKAIRR